MTDTPLQRTIKIGNASVGLIGIDTALNHVLQQKDLAEDEAVSYLYNEIKKHNYIPGGADDVYREALLREYKKLRGEEVDQDKRLQIRILGPGCVSCNKLGTMLFEILQTMNIAADIEQVHDLENDLQDARHRIEVLEKIVTDQKYDLSREINDLASGSPRS